MAFITGGADADESNVFDKGWKESMAWTGSGGILLDASLTGGNITVDDEHNELLYGAGVTAAQVRHSPALCRARCQGSREVIGLRVGHMLVENGRG